MEVQIERSCINGGCPMFDQQRAERFNPKPCILLIEIMLYCVCSKQPIFPQISWLIILGCMVCIILLGCSNSSCFSASQPNHITLGDPWATTLKSAAFILQFSLVNLCCSLARRANTFSHEVVSQPIQLLDIGFVMVCLKIRLPQFQWDSHNCPQ